MVEVEHYSWKRIIGPFFGPDVVYSDASFFFGAIILKMQRGLAVAPVYAHTYHFVPAAMTRLLFLCQTEQCQDRFKGFESRENWGAISV